MADRAAFSLTLAHEADAGLCPYRNENTPYEGDTALDKRHGALGAIRPSSIRSTVMERHSTPLLTIQEFEQAADALISVMLALVEQHVSTSEKLKKAPDPTLQNAALSVHTSIKCFIAIECINNQ